MAGKSQSEMIERGLGNVCNAVAWLLLATIGFFSFFPSSSSNAWMMAGVCVMAGLYAISGSGPFARLLRTPGNVLAFFVRFVIQGAGR